MPQALDFSFFCASKQAHTESSKVYVAKLSAVISPKIVHCSLEGLGRLILFAVI